MKITFLTVLWAREVSENCPFVHCPTAAGKDTGLSAGIQQIQVWAGKKDVEPIVCRLKDGRVRAQFYQTILIYVYQSP